MKITIITIALQFSLISLGLSQVCGPGFNSVYDNIIVGTEVENESGVYGSATLFSKTLDKFTITNTWWNEDVFYYTREGTIERLPNNAYSIENQIPSLRFINDTVQITDNLGDVFWEACDSTTIPIPSSIVTYTVFGDDVHVRTDGETISIYNIYNHLLLSYKKGVGLLYEQEAYSPGASSYIANNGYIVGDDTTGTLINYLPDDEFYYLRDCTPFYAEIFNIKIGSYFQYETIRKIDEDSIRLIETYTITDRWSLSGKLYFKKEGHYQKISELTGFSEGIIEDTLIISDTAHQFLYSCPNEIKSINYLGKTFSGTISLGNDTKEVIDTSNNDNVFIFKKETGLWYASFNDSLLYRCLGYAYNNDTIGSFNNSINNELSSNIILERGWNLISFNKDIIDNSREGVFGSFLLNIIEIKTEEEFYKNNNSNFLNSLEEIQPAQAYWIKCDTTYNLPITGSTITPQYYNYQLNRGWNLIGNPYSVDISIINAFNSIFDKIEIIKSIDSYYIPNDEINTLISIEPNKGYYIKVSEDCSLIWE